MRLSVSFGGARGFSVWALPWTFPGPPRRHRQKTIRNRVTTYDQSYTRVVDVTETEDVVKKDVEFEFPLSWSVGALVKAGNKLYTSLDLSQTALVRFFFQGGWRIPDQSSGRHSVRTK